MTKQFELVGIRPAEAPAPAKKKKWYQGRPLLASAFLIVLAAGCLFCEAVMTKDPTYMDLQHCIAAPGQEFLFGTDTMGRDIFSMIWYGGRISLFIGVIATAISTVIAVVFGAASGCAPAWLDDLMMRLTEILMSVPCWWSCFCRRSSASRTC